MRIRRINRMDAVKFIEERNRMCNSFSPDCEGCLVDEEKPVMDECFRWMLENPERAVKIVEKWSAANPRKTRQSVFLEQYPEADLSTGTVNVCPNSLYEGKCDCARYQNCLSCKREFWSQEV